MISFLHYKSKYSQSRLVGVTCNSTINNWRRQTDGCWGGGFGGGGFGGGGGNAGGGNGGSLTGGAFCRRAPAFPNSHLYPLALKCRLTSFSRLFQRKRFSLKQSNPRLRTVVGSVTR